jgi:FkbM family methyltransferase
MQTFAQLIQPGDTVIELGAHVGYTSLYLAKLAGEGGKLFAFEPQLSNLRYLERNVASLPQVEVVPKAASDRQGVADFFVDPRTGENSTLVPDEFEAVFAANRKKAFSNEQFHATQVETVTLDDFITARGIRPDFIKIDIEGAELLALRGMQVCLAAFKPKLMVEVTCEVESVTALLEGLGYKAYTPRLDPWDGSGYGGRNRFYLPEETVPISRSASARG